MKRTGEILLFVDFDDAAIDSVHGFMRIFRKQGWLPAGSTREYSEHWGELMQAPPGVVKRRSDYVWEQRLASDFLPMPGAVDALRRLKEEGLYGRSVELWGATSRPITSREVTHETIDRHFDGIITGCVFAGFYDGPPLEEHYGASKEALYREYGPDGAFDDQSKHTNGAKLAGVPVSLHFGMHAAPVHDACFSDVLHASDWAEAEGQIRAGFRYLETPQAVS